jgi:cellulose synthase/poly-beta-1,6-N-acetylglucosamine synthase-like glycosyltransferase
MISVLTMTYKRHHLLEEAMESFIRQTPIPDAEMIIINDNPEVDYVYDHPSIRIFNLKERFSSIAAKLKWGYKQCKNHCIYRLDDDDLLTRNALADATMGIVLNNGYEVYRSKDHYFFVNNTFEGIGSNINNGNIYTKSYLDRITWPDNSIGEDAEITFSHNARIYEDIPTTMIYRWGMGTLHISGMGVQPNEIILAQADKVLDNTTGTIQLNPNFKEEYYEQIN